jgi:hypothetical protein
MTGRAWFGVLGAGILALLTFAGVRCCRPMSPRVTNRSDLQETPQLTLEIHDGQLPALFDVSSASSARWSVAVATRLPNFTSKGTVGEVALFDSRTWRAIELPSVSGSVYGPRVVPFGKSVALVWGDTRVRSGESTSLRAVERQWFAMLDEGGKWSESKRLPGGPDSWFDASELVGDSVHEELTVATVPFDRRESGVILKSLRRGRWVQRRILEELHLGSVSLSRRSTTELVLAGIGFAGQTEANTLFVALSHDDGESWQWSRLAAGSTQVMAVRARFSSHTASGGLISLWRLQGGTLQLREHRFTGDSYSEVARLTLPSSAFPQLTAYELTSEVSVIAVPFEDNRGNVVTRVYLGAGRSLIECESIAITGAAQPWFVATPNSGTVDLVWIAGSGDERRSRVATLALTPRTRRAGRGSTDPFH